MTVANRTSVVSAYRPSSSYLNFASGNHKLTRLPLVWNVIFISSPLTPSKSNMNLTQSEFNSDGNIRLSVYSNNNRSRQIRQYDIIFISENESLSTNQRGRRVLFSISCSTQCLLRRIYKLRFDRSLFNPLQFETQAFVLSFRERRAAC